MASVCFVRLSLTHSFNSYHNSHYGSETVWTKGPYPPEVFSSLIHDIRVDAPRALLYTSTFPELLPVLLGEQRVRGLTQDVLHDSIHLFFSVCQHLLSFTVICTAIPLSPCVTLSMRS